MKIAQPGASVMPQYSGEFRRGGARIMGYSRNCSCRPLPGPIKLGKRILTGQELRLATAPPDIHGAEGTAYTLRTAGTRPVVALMDGAIGIVNRKRLPPVGLGSNSIFPPCASTICLAIESPSPAPRRPRSRGSR